MSCIADITPLSYSSEQKIMWLIIGMYLIFYVLVFQHLSDLHKHATINAEHRLSEFLDKLNTIPDIPPEFKTNIIEIRVFIRETLQLINLSHNLKFCVYTIFLTPIIVILEIFNAVHFDRQYTKTVEDAVYLFFIQLITERLGLHLFIPKEKLEI